MIFVTVGTQLPFERLIRGMDAWAEQHGDETVIAQVGMTKYRPRHMEVTEKLDPTRYQEYFENARLVVSHVGMGTIISGLERAKQLVLMPRLASLGEHRNDHQVGTAKKFQHFDNIHIVESPAEMHTAIDRLLEMTDVGQSASLSLAPALEGRLREFVLDVKERQTRI